MMERTDARWVQDGGNRHRTEGTSIHGGWMQDGRDGRRTEGMGTGLRGSLWDRGVRCGMEWTIVG